MITLFLNDRKRVTLFGMILAFGSSRVFTGVFWTILGSEVLCLHAATTAGEAGPGYGCSLFKADKDPSDVSESKYLPQCWRVDIGSRGKHWQVSSPVTFEEEQQAGCCKEGEMYLVRLPPSPPRPTQAKEGVATNGWLSWKIGFFFFFIFHLTRQSASSSMEPRVNNFPSANVVYISFVISTFRLH